MEPAYFSQVHVERFGCLRDVKFSLTPLHALIGPNDSGKTTFLRAMDALVRQSDWWQLPSMRDLAGPSTASLRGQRAARFVEFQFAQSGPIAHAPPNVQVRMMRLDPDEMRRPAPLLPPEHPLWFLTERGYGLASLYDALFSQEPDRFFAVQASVRAHFPHVKSVTFRNVGNQKEIGVSLHDGTQVSAGNLSEGLLYFLAFAALKQLPGAHLFLVEEPENGLHPSRISVVMKFLRELSETSQVILATHSPLVVNELRGEEITVVTRDPVSGTRAQLLSTMPRYEAATKVYLPGEYWVSYCDGNQEAPLREEAPREPATAAE